MPTTTEGSGMPTSRPKIGCPVMEGGVGVGVGRTITCPYPLKVQTCPPRDQRPALGSRVSGKGFKLTVYWSL